MSYQAEILWFFIGLTLMGVVTLLFLLRKQIEKYDIKKARSILGILFWLSCLGLTYIPASLEIFRIALVAGLSAFVVWKMHTWYHAPSYDTKWPDLTSEEVNELIHYDQTFVNRHEFYGLRQEFRIAGALVNLTMKKMSGIGEYDRSIVEAREHLLKAEIYDPNTRYRYAEMREKLHIPPPLEDSVSREAVPEMWPNYQQKVTSEGLVNRRQLELQLKNKKFSSH